MLNGRSPTHNRRKYLHPNHGTLVDGSQFEEEGNGKRESKMKTVIRRLIFISFTL